MSRGDSSTEYPARIRVDYPETTDRLTTFFRVFTVIPIAIVLGALTGGSATVIGGTNISLGGAGITFLPALLLILFRQKYPRWWFDWNLALTRFGLRVASYLLLLRHEYPSTDEEQAVHVELDYPDVKGSLNRGLPLVKWFLAIPHIIILVILGLAVFFVSIYAWFAILFTGRYPRGVFDFVEGVLRWWLRVQAYAIVLITDRYPPFSLRP
ncbi:MAG: DUF4389 domain-containing protein [Thermoleophilia bacterium]|nr:DUF4389 domain-containing protein [Thermoleophilia bacterium]